MTWQEEISIKIGRLVAIMEKQDLDAISSSVRTTSPG